jgi:hypothetical protein
VVNPLWAAVDLVRMLLIAFVAIALPARLHSRS